MISDQPTQPMRRATRRTRSTLVIAAAAVTAMAVGTLGFESLAADARPRSFEPAEWFPLPPLFDTPLGEADGVVGDGVTVFDDGVPAVARLDPDLLDALQRAARDAADDDVTFFVNSGWRSPAYQEQLLRDAVSEHGSEEEAARWVASPDTSLHVSGDAIDVGHSDATKWLSENGAEYGLCQIYDNEPWHYELRPDAGDQGCPPTYADPTHDPRLQR